MMNFKKTKRWVSVTMLIFFLMTFSELLLANEPTVLYPGFPSVEESKAFKKFVDGPRNDYAKILFLIDRFAEADAQIIYDGRYFTMSFSSRFARLFFSAQYRGETPKKWIMRYCNTSFLTGELIWVKLPDEQYRLARDILMNEIKFLNDLIEKKAA